MTRTRKPARPLRDPSKPCNAEVNLLMARKDAQTNQRLILAVITSIALSSPEIASVVGLSRVAARRHIRFMHADGRIHVARWSRACIRYERMYIAGPGVDAVQPPWLTVSERAERARVKVQIDPETAMNRRFKAQARYVKRRRPRPDPAASWITPTTGATQ